MHKVNVKTIRQLAQIFVAFSEKLNFSIQERVMITHVELGTLWFLLLGYRKVVSMY